MATIRDEAPEQGKGHNNAQSCCAGNTEAVRQFALNSLNGAAIALCMGPDELRELLNKKPEGEELKQMRMRVAELVTENAMLKHELEKSKEAEKSKPKCEYDRAEEELLKFINTPQQIKFRFFRF